jgi:hypothetical protein
MLGEQKKINGITCGIGAIVGMKIYVKVDMQ